MGMLEDFKRLKKYSFPLIPYKVAQTKEEALLCARTLKYPVVLKILSETISHKSDLGGVVVNIKTPESLSLAYDEMMTRTKGNKIDGVLVQKMARKGVELIIGTKKDAQFGHMIVLGLGGIYVEIFKDISARLCPITKTDVEEMVDELKSHPILTGARGKKAIHLKALTSLMLKVCEFAIKEDIKEMDLNPVVFDEKGFDLIDVRMS